MGGLCPQIPVCKSGGSLGKLVLVLLYGQGDENQSHTQGKGPSVFLAFLSCSFPGRTDVISHRAQQHPPCLVPSAFPISD